MNVLSQLAFSLTSLLGFSCMHLLRSLIPSWRFFDDIGPVIRIMYKTDSSTWASLFPTEMQRHWYQLFVNGESNLRLAIHSVAERLASETGVLQEGHEQEISSSVTYRLLENAVRSQIQSRQIKSKNFQFKLLMDEETLLISELHEIA